MQNHVIICGLGNLGFHVFELLNRAGIKVAVITDKSHAEWIWQIEQSGGKFLLGDARDDNLLLEAGIKDAKAILALTSQDRINLSIAVDAQKLNPKVKIISRIFDTDLGNLVSAPFDIQQVFSASEIAAPIFFHSIFDKNILGQFCFKKQNFIVSEENNNQSSSAMILATSENKSLVAKSKDKEKKQISPFFKFLYHYYNLRTPIFLFFKRFLIILFFIILFSTLILSWAMPLSFTDAVYFVITTVTSVGYGDINFLQSPTWLKYFGCLLMLTGTAIMAILFGSVAEMVIAKKLPNVTGGRPLPKINHVVIVGFDHIGARIVNSLIEDNTPIVIIENEIVGRYPEDITRLVTLVNGNPKSSDTLNRANIKTAKALMAVTKDDIENLSISIAAKKLNPTITEITQINNTRIGGSLQAALSLTRVYSVPFIAGPYFLAAVFKPNIIFAIEWQNQIVYLTEVNGELTIDLILLKPPSA